MIHPSQFRITTSTYPADDSRDTLAASMVVLHVDGFAPPIMVWVTADGSVGLTAKTGVADGASREFKVAAAVLDWAVRNRVELHALAQAIHTPKPIIDWSDATMAAFTDISMRYRVAMCAAAMEIALATEGIPFNPHAPVEGMRDWLSGGDRVAYTPSISPSLPWATFRAGTAKARFATFREAARSLGHFERTS